MHASYRAERRSPLAGRPHVARVIDLPARPASLGLCDRNACTGMLEGISNYRVTLSTWPGRVH